MFRREAHRVFEPVLDALDGDALASFAVALGGATRIALSFGEVRESRDLDFLGSDAGGWARLRTAIAERGVRALFRHTLSLGLPREAVADQYGVRFPVVVAETTLRVEIVREARIALSAAVHEVGCPVPCISVGDCYAEKLLANADRGADPTTFDRDLVDLAVLRAKHGAIPAEAMAAALAAYGASARTALERSVQRFRADPDRRERDYRALRVDDAATVASGVDLLADDLALPAPVVE